MKHRKGGRLPLAWRYDEIQIKPHPKWDGTDTLEKDEERFCDSLVTAIGFTIVRISQPRATNQTRGIADRLYVHDLRRVHLWFEIKRPRGGTWSPDQQAFKALVEIGGMQYGVGARNDLIDRLNILGFKLQGHLC